MIHDHGNKIPHLANHAQPHCQLIHHRQLLLRRNRRILQNLAQLTDFSWAVRQALTANRIQGAEGAEIDHIELHSPSPTAGLDSRNFVLCPGKEYDRSPCGTGTSAKLACLYAEGLLTPGQIWRQESIIGSIFEGRVALREGALIPSISGAAFVTAEATMILDPRDAFCWGIGGL